MKNITTVRPLQTHRCCPRNIRIRLISVIVTISTTIFLTSCNEINTLPLSDIPADVEEQIGIPIADEENVEGLVFFLDRSEGVLHVPDEEQLAAFITSGALEPIKWTPGSSTAFASGSAFERQTVRVRAIRRSDLLALSAMPGDWRFFADARERQTTPANVGACNNRRQMHTFNGGMTWFSTLSFMRITRHHEYLLDTAEIETSIEIVEVVSKTDRYARVGCTGAGNPWVDYGPGYWVVLVRSWP